MRRAMHVDEVALEEPLVRQLLIEPVQVMTCVRLAPRQGPTTSESPVCLVPRTEPMAP